MDYTELFDRYIDGQLEGSELEDFKMKLKTDNEFRKNLEEYVRLNNVTADVVRDLKGAKEEFQIDEETDKISQKDVLKYGRDKRDTPDERTASFMEEINRAEKDSLGKHNKPIRKYLPIQLGIAATAIIVILFSLLILLRHNKINHGDLFTLFYKPFVETEEIIEITRTSDNFYYAMKVFEAGDWARATVLFEELSDSAVLKVYSIFYSGLTYMQMGQWEAAVEKLKEAISYGETKMEKPARWYLGLCFLRIEDSKSARGQFEILASTKNEYTARSRRILRLMR